MIIDKQIEEITIEFAKINCNPKGCYGCNLCDEYGSLELNCEDYLYYRKQAEDFYNAGYRKASEVALETVDDFQRRIRHIFLEMCCGNDYNTLNLLEIDSAIEALYDRYIAELKKKYTEGEG